MRMNFLLKRLLILHAPKVYGFGQVQANRIMFPANVLLTRICPGQFNLSRTPSSGLFYGRSFPAGQ
jgi:hypothetical protein